uniref:Uncharacterized protein n=1 Tax=Nicotiana tabacum TaxID=4097 RepID=A0A1S4BTV0_TOBAC|nr:PREDICTED: uncharacterized protein LOC107811829 [Nicotiana tabacum]
MLLPPVPDEWAAEAFTKGLNSRSSNASRKLKESLLEFQATTWEDVHNRYESKIRIEGDQLGFSASVKGRDREKNKEKSKDDFDTNRRSLRSWFLPYKWAEGRGKGFRSEDKFATNRRTDRGRNNRSLQNKETLDSSYPRLSEYNFNVSLVEMISAMRNIKDARFPKPIRSDHDQGILIYGATTTRETVTGLGTAEPSKAGEDPPRLTINIIFEGNEINGVTFSAVKKTKVLVTQNKRLWEVAEDDITFTKEDADGLLLPHNSTLVISLNVLDFKIKRVLVDPGCSANIIQWRVLEQDKLTGSVIPATKLLVGLNLASVATRGEILPPMNVERVMNTTLFEVVDGDMGYNIILGRP